MLLAYAKVHGVTECLNKNGTVFILHITWQPSIGFFVLKTKIHMQILNTKPFLYNFRGAKKYAKQNRILE